MNKPLQGSMIAIANGLGDVPTGEVGDDAVGSLRRRSVSKLGLGLEDDHGDFPSVGLFFDAFGRAIQLQRHEVKPIFICVPCTETPLCHLDSREYLGRRLGDGILG